MYIREKNTVTLATCTTLSPITINLVSHRIVRRSVRKRVSCTIVKKKKGGGVANERAE